MTDNAFTGLAPELVWKHFAAIAAIPRNSGEEAAVAAHIRSWAETHGFEVRTDNVGNLLVLVPATPGREGAPTIVLQGHLDMVCQKDSDSDHDFSRDPIAVRRDGDYLTATKTTLGADNGVGVAAGMALAEDPDAIHGPLALLCTIEEETGLTGAQGLEASLIPGTILLNLDSEEEGALYVGCAGGVDSNIALPLRRRSDSGAGAPHELRVAGLIGGHSGLDINCGRGNALRILSRVLDRLRRQVDFGLLSLGGGDKHNAIPREARATLMLDDRGAASAAVLLDTITDELRGTFARTDPKVTLALTPLPPTSDAEMPLEQDSRNALLDLLLALPHGVLAMSQEVEGLVESSSNLAVARIEGDRAIVQESSRSSRTPALAEIRDAIAATARLAGADCTAHGQYPGWQPKMDSPLLRRAQRVYRETLGTTPTVKAIHAGLECGIIGERKAGLEMLSFGPQIEWPHSPSERVKISSVAPFYRFLRALVTDFANVN